MITKRSVILLELLIAMGMTLFILSTLIFFYYQMSQINTAMDKDQNESFRKLYVENRLAHIFPRIVSSSDPSSDFHFFSMRDSGGLLKAGTTSLVFTFDNGVQQDKQMSYNVIARVFVDPDGNLTVAKWPSEKRWKENEQPPISKEILLDRIEELSFAFFIPPASQKEASLLPEQIQPEAAQQPNRETAPNGPPPGQTPGSPPPQTNPQGKQEIPPDFRGRWIEEWPKEYRQLPAIVRMRIVRKRAQNQTEVMLFAFPLPEADQPITYED